MKSGAVVFLCLAVVCGSDAFLFDLFKTKKQNATKPIDEACIAKARQGDCQFYVCFDERHPCDSDSNYALKYGWRFCSRFDLYKDQLTNEGRAWLNNSRLCSMERMLEYYRSNSINCDDLEDEMQEKHAECEVESGMCRGNLLTQNREAFSDVYALNRRSVTHFMMSVKHCAASAMREVATWFHDQFHDNGNSSIAPFLRDLQRQMRQLQEDFQVEVDKIRESFREHRQSMEELIKKNEDDDA
jgi:hypothetical protein